MRSGNLIERKMKKIMKPSFFKKIKLLAYKTCDPSHLTRNTKYKKNHETQFLINQILNDKKKISHTKGLKKKE
jgi:hypothetical protein